MNNKFCINTTLPQVESLVAQVKSDLDNLLNEKQIALLWNKWIELEPSNIDKLPTKDDINQTYGKLANIEIQDLYNKETVVEKTDILDYLQFVYFRAISNIVKKKTLTKSDIVQNQERVFLKMPIFLEKEGLSYIAGNFKEYRDLLIATRLNKFQIPEIDLDEQEGKDKDTFGNNSSVYTDNKHNCSDEVVYLIASLTTDETIYGLPRPVNFDITWNKIQNILANSPADLGFMAKKLIESGEPFVPQLLEKLEVISENEILPETPENTATRTSFTEAFAKQHRDITVNPVGLKEAYSTIDKQEIASFKDNAKSSFWNSEYSHKVNGQAVLNKEKYLALDFDSSEESLKDFMKVFGIELQGPLSDSVITDITRIKIEVDKFIVNNELDWLDNNNEYKNGKLVKKGLAVLNRLNNIVATQLPYIKLNKNLSTRNAEGKQQFTAANHSYTSKLFSKLQNGLKKPTNALEKLIADGKVVLNLVSGATSEDRTEANTFNNLSLSDIISTMFSDMFSSISVIHFPRTSDKTQENSYQIKVSNANKDAEMAYTDITDSVLNKLYDAFQSDLKQEFHPEWKYGAKQPWSFWLEIGLDEFRDNEKKIYFPKFKEIILKYIEKQRQPLIDLMIQEGVINYEKQKIAFTNSNFEKIPGSFNDKINKIVDCFNFNEFYFGILNTQMTEGSCCAVKPDNMFKRFSGPVAESRATRTDMTLVNSLNEEFDKANLKYNAEYLKVYVHAETEETSTDKNLLAIDEIYSKNNLDDAQGIMALPMYRVTCKMTNQWTDKQEQCYQDIMAGKEIDTKEFKSAFPPLKPVGYSVVTIDGYKVPIYIKTAVYPISPADTKGLENGDKWQHSLNTGVGLYIPKSGIKMATPSTLLPIYDKDGNINLENTTFDFPMEFFGIQLDINPKTTMKQLIGTQIRKLLTNNLFENGKASDPKYKEWVEKNIKVYEDISEIETQKLYERAGIQMIDDEPRIVNYNQLKQMVTDELLSKDMPLNVIESIKYIIDNNGNLNGNTIDSLPARQKIMNMLNSIVTNRLIKLTTNGTALVQVSQQGWRLKKIENPTDENILAIDSAIDFVSDEAKLNYYKKDGLGFVTKGDTKFKEKINIYAGTNENSDLSNFAIRPFTLQGVEYDSVEQYFQLQKYQIADILEFDYDSKDAQKIANKIQEIADKISNTKNGATLKSLGGTRIPGVKFNEERWNVEGKIAMKNAIKASFEQNSNALNKLLNTGNSELTHTQDKTKWGELFPKILMEVRTELQKENNFKIENNKTGEAEILIPYKYKHYVKKDGTLDEQLLINIGYRIPTQGHNSMLHLKVVGYLPPHLDQIVVMPKEITSQGGSDFDVDKINIFIPNNIIIDGQTKFISMDMNPEEIWKQRITELENKRLSYEEFKLNKQVKTDIGNVGANYLNFAPEEFTDEELEEISLELNMPKEKWIQDFKLQQLQNEIITQTVEILSDPNQYESIITPNSPGSLKEDAYGTEEEKGKGGIYGKLLENGKTPKKIDLSFYNLFQGIVLLIKTYQMFASKALVGVFASQATHHALAQQVGLHIKTGRKLFFEHNKINVNGEDRISLSGIEDVKGNLISNILGNNFLSAAVDAAKDDYLTELGINLQTGDFAAAFKRTGGDNKYMYGWINQPIIQDYLNLTKKSDSLTAKFMGEDLNKSKIIEKVLKNYGYDKDSLQYLAEKYNKNYKLAEELQFARESAGEYTVQQLEDRWFQDKKNGLMDVHLLDDFLYFEDLSATIRKSISTSKFDTAGPGKDVIESTLLALKYKSFINEMNDNKGYTLATVEEKSEAPYANIIAKTLLNVFYKKSFNFVGSIYQDLVALNKSTIIQDAVKGLIYPTDSNFVAKSLDSQKASLVYAAVVNYLIQSKIKLPNNLVYGDNTVHHKINNIQKNVNHPLHNNNIIQSFFTVELSGNDTLPSISVPRNKNSTTEELNLYTNAFEEIYNVDPELYNDLFTISMYQTGMLQSPSSFYNVLPPNLSILKVAEAINQANPDNSLNIARAVLENIGNQLDNIQKVKGSSKDRIVGDRLFLDDPTKAKGKLFINYTEQIPDWAIEQGATPESGIFEDKGAYFQKLKSKNYKKLFYDFSSNSQPIEKTGIFDESTGTEEPNGMIEKQEDTVEAVTMWDSLEDWQKEKYKNVFPNSKIKDIVYRVDTEDFKVFDKTKQSSEKAFYFFKDLKAAQEWLNIGFNGKGIIRKMLLNMENPGETDLKFEPYNNAFFNKELKRSQEQGKDSHIFYDVADMSYVSTQYAVFNPEQIFIIPNLKYVYMENTEYGIKYFDRYKNLIANIPEKATGKYRIEHYNNIIKKANIPNEIIKKYTQSGYATYIDYEEMFKNAEIKSDLYSLPITDISKPEWKINNDINEFIPKKRKLFDETIKELRKGSVVEYNGEKYLYWNTNESGKAQLIKTDGTKFSGTPDINKLKVLGSYKTTKYNNIDYIVTDKGNIFSGASGNLVYTAKDSSSKAQKEKIIAQAYNLTPFSLWNNYKDRILAKTPNETIKLIEQYIKEFGIEYVESYLDHCY